MGNRRPARRDRGAAAVEFALVVPLLLLLVFAIISYGYMLSFRQALSQAGAEGARAAAVAPRGLTTTAVTARAVAAVNDGLSSYDITCAGGRLTRGGTDVGSCTVSSPQTCTSGATTLTQCVEVSLVYDYRSHPLLPSVGLGFALPSSLSFTTEAQVS